MRIALVHEWLTKPGGSEKVLGDLARLFPEAPIYCLVWQPGVEAEFGIDPSRIRPSFVQRLPGAAHHYRKLLPLYPLAVQQHDLSGFDRVLANHHCVAHGARPAGGAALISYCHTPMRYAWEQRGEYLDDAGLGKPPLRWAADLLLDRLRVWDYAAAQKVTRIYGNSANVAARIKRNYGREAGVIYPAVELERFYRPAAAPPRGSHFLVVSRLVNYKKIDAALWLAQANPAMQLRIVGDGPESGRLRGLAASLPNVQFLGRLPAAEIAREMQSARALLFPGEEDFGLTAVEALAAGCPVIHCGRGGAAEISAAALGEMGAALHYDFEAVPAAAPFPGTLSVLLDDAAAVLASPAMHDKLEALFGLARFNAAMRQAVEAAG